MGNTQSAVDVAIAKTTDILPAAAGDTRPALVDLRNRRATPSCSRVSQMLSGVELVFVGLGAPCVIDAALTLAACLLPRSMGLAAAGDRLVIATIRVLMISANVKNLAPFYSKRSNHYYDAVLVPRTSC
jgi:hypothetical protein